MRAECDDDADEVRVFTREQLAVLLAVVHPRHRLMFRLGPYERLTAAFTVDTYVHPLPGDSAPALDLDV